MIPSPLKTVVVGFGKVAAGYADDPVMAQAVEYATHAQVLADHPAFAWQAVVDVSDDALELARTRWHIPVAVRSISELVRQYQPDVAVLATPPQHRLSIVEQLGSLRSVLVEKPLGTTLAEAKEFLDYCAQRGILVQVNLWRRADETLRSIASGRLLDFIGAPQAVFGVYGNGLLNNGTHLIDLIRMLLGEIVAVQTVGGAVPYTAGPIADDMNLPINLQLRGGVVVMLQPIRFEHYRELSLDIWGEKGRLSIVQEGLSILLYSRRDNRGMTDEREVASDQPQTIPTTIGQAFYRVYDNLAAAVNEGSILCCPGESALQTATVIEAVVQSSKRQGALVEIDEILQLS